jgi:glycosyltransferase involved in cell wall biosynthesis
MFAHDSLATNAKGGTELMKFALQAAIPADLQEHFQIFVSRVEDEMDPTKIRIYWLQDLPGDPASAHLANGGWAKFHLLVFSTNWQMQAYINHYDIPWSHCLVILNAPVKTFEAHTKPDPDAVTRLAYWSTPHRGLNILVPVFKKLCEKYDNIELDVYSSFELYGWGQRDAQFQALFDDCKNTPKINYHGTVANDDLRERLKETHILAYPSTWTETSCITLMEAMQAGLQCVHSNLGALPETAANWTMMYQYDEDVNRHASTFYNVLDYAIGSISDETVQNRLANQTAYTNAFFNWESRGHQWDSLLAGLVANNPDRSVKAPQQFFNYKT